MATPEENRRELQRAIAKQKTASNSVAKAPAIDRKAMWSRAMKGAAKGPKVRVEGE